MDPVRYLQVKDLLNRALDVPAEERSSFLDTVTDDEDLRAEVHSLLESMNAAGDFLDEPLLGSGSADTLSPGTRIGFYRVEDKIGHGGMGAVYVAFRADDQFKKKVAIKLIRRGMDTDFIVRRFRTERQILASLDHPNIGRLIDGGATEDGLPYFVMEYIEGKPLHEYCDERRLSVSERLILFRRICDAVQYAHRNLIIHRDLKPSNILITNDGTPKLLDFGIAKLLDADMSLTRLEPTASMFRMMTPEYASPEQVRGEIVTTASDVYSLGVILYELLSGHRPYRFASRSPHDIEQAICAEEPERPSTAVGKVEEDRRGLITPEAVGSAREGSPERLRRRLRGDLDNIVLKALRKQPKRRYESVEQLSADLQRHLQGMPVTARKDTVAYRATKFIGRHKAGVAAAALLFASLIGGATAALWQAHLANRERDRAEHRFNDVRKLANAMVTELHDAIEPLPGSTAARELLIRKAQEYLDSLMHEAKDDPTLERELAFVYEKVGDVQGGPNRPNLGNTAAAVKSYRKALDLYVALASAEPNNSDIQRSLAAGHGRMCTIYQVTGDAADALANCRKEVAIREKLSSGHPDNSILKRELAGAYDDLGGALKMVGEFVSARDTLSKELHIFEDLSAADPADLKMRRYLSSAYSRMGAISGTLRDYEASLRYFHLSLELCLSMVQANPGDAEDRLALSFVYSDVGWALAQLGNIRGGLEYYRKALPIREALAAADPLDARARATLANSHGRIGRLLLLLNDPNGAAQHFRKQVALNEGLVATDPMQIANHTDLAEAYSNTAAVASYLAAKQAARSGAADYWREARDWYRKALDIYVKVRAQGALHAEHAEEPARLRQEIDRCSAALARSS